MSLTYADVYDAVQLQHYFTPTLTYVCAPGGLTAVHPFTLTPFAYDIILCVSDLAPNVSEGLLEDIFSSFGEVALIVIARSNAQAFVFYLDQNDIELAMSSLRGEDLLGKNCFFNWGLLYGWNASGTPTVRILTELDSTARPLNRAIAIRRPEEKSPKDTDISQVEVSVNEVKSDTASETVSPAEEPTDLTPVIPPTTVLVSKPEVLKRFGQGWITLGSNIPNKHPVRGAQNWNSSIW
ncbi:hypothetical protein IAR55_006594 [Kwoniella newhampshirensis]|uniref:RRM domain-containing protein n=1 Tax=Kwoniella newhampshirensis TaxID=1651941 RepID=A0AAW0YEK7_9TREE